MNFTDRACVCILAGGRVLTDTAGGAVMLRVGDRYAIRPGFAGTWTVLEATLKEYVIRAPPRESLP